MHERSIWVDTDFGFDDLWALLLLRLLEINVEGVSLVCGNTQLNRVIANASSARQVFDFPWSYFPGATSPLEKPLQTADAVLGDTGMQTRGLELPSVDAPAELISAQEALSLWLDTPDENSRDVLALGPLTNLACHCMQHPESYRKINRIVWMGGSSGRGNQTPWSEFNAFTDPDAAAVVLSGGVPVDIVDLELCRRVAFGEQHIPEFAVDSHPDQQLLKDLVGGYLDIALNRGRKVMNIYDPVAVLALAGMASVEFVEGSIEVSLPPGRHQGQTVFSPRALGEIAADTAVRLAISIDGKSARTACMAALHVPARD